MHQQFILHIAFPEDNRLKDLKLYDWQTKFNNVKDPVVNILAPLSLKTRKDLYERLMKLTLEPIVAVLYPLPFKTYMAKIPTSDVTKIQQTYSKMQPPVQFIDCDEMQLADNSVSLFDAVLADKNQYPELDEHGTPHHKETISEHTIMVSAQLVSMTINQEFGERRCVSPSFKSHDTAKDINVLHTVALYHDLGKYWTKQFDEDANHYRYPNHENVSAMIFVTELLLKPEKYNFLNDTPMSDDEDAYSSVLDGYVFFKNYREAFTKIVTQVILNHMLVKTDGYTPRVISRRELTEYERYLLSIFSEADSRGRIC